jgi:hypothetical protein
VRKRNYVTDDGADLYTLRRHGLTVGAVHASLATFVCASAPHAR